MEAISSASQRQHLPLGALEILGQGAAHGQHLEVERAELLGDAERVRADDARARDDAVGLHLGQFLLQRVIADEKPLRRTPHDQLDLLEPVGRLREVGVHERHAVGDIGVAAGPEHGELRRAVGRGRLDGGWLLRPDERGACGERDKDQ